MNLHDREDLRKLQMALEIRRCLRYDPRALAYKAKMHRLKSTFFPH